MYWMSFASRSFGSGMKSSSFRGRGPPTRCSADDAMGAARRGAFGREGVGEGMGDQLGAGGVAGRGEVDALVDEPGVFDIGGPVVDAHVRITKAPFFEFFV